MSLKVSNKNRKKTQPKVTKVDKVVEVKQQTQFYPEKFEVKSWHFAIVVAFILMVFLV